MLELMLSPQSMLAEIGTWEHIHLLHSLWQRDFMYFP